MSIPSWNRPSTWALLCCLSFIYRSVIASSLPPNSKLIQVQIVHRHGDRTPITPLKNEGYWRDQLPKEEVLKKISEGTKIVRDINQPRMKHGAAGTGVFGQLSMVGLLQMVELGQRVREELYCPTSGMFCEDKRPLTHHETCLRVVSTDFPRTIQSVQAFLVGLFPDGLHISQQKCDESEVDTSHVEIDVRHTVKMIPDPQPRRYVLQEILEKELSQNDPDLRKKDAEMRELAERASFALGDLLASGDAANAVSFGVGEEKDGEVKILPWGQLSEITTCLRTRDQLPDAISHDDQEAIVKHAAHRWFALLRNPTLANIAMDKMVSDILKNANLARYDYSRSIPLHVYSAHDSTLIGLMCALRLEQPSEWPEYASALKLELFAVENDLSSDVDKKDYICRFSLNGQYLKCNWGSESCPRSFIDLDELDTLINEARSEDIKAVQEHQQRKET